MKISEVIIKLNDKKTKNAEVANELGLSSSTLSRKLKVVGYNFNNKTKEYDYVGDISQKNITDNKLFLEVNHSKQNKKSDTNQKKNVKKSEIKKEIIEEKSELNFTEEEIKFVKSLYKEKRGSGALGLAIDFAMLPSRGETKKHSIEISKSIYEDFDTFAKAMYKEKRLDKNDLFEVALTQLMRTYRV